MVSVQHKMAPFDPARVYLIKTLCFFGIAVYQNLHGTTTRKRIESILERIVLVSISKLHASAQLQWALSDSRKLEGRVLGKIVLFVKVDMGPPAAGAMSSRKEASVKFFQVFSGRQKGADLA